MSTDTIYTVTESWKYKLLAYAEAEFIHSAKREIILFTNYEI